ncbi:MAG: PotD/PotF family extracellular solute-binding protein [Hyphomicrobiales bacterium]
MSTNGLDTGAKSITPNGKSTAAIAKPNSASDCHDGLVKTLATIKLGSRKTAQSLGKRSFLAGTGAVAAAIAPTPASGFAAGEGGLNFYNWNGYIGLDTLNDFTRAIGIDMAVNFFADGNELFARFRAGNFGYDVIVPSDDYVERMITGGMV